MNIGRIPQVNAHPENEEVQTFIRANEVDIFGLAKTNVNWTNVMNQYQLHEKL